MTQPANLVVFVSTETIRFGVDNLDPQTDWEGFDGADGIVFMRQKSIKAPKESYGNAMSES